MHNILFYFIAFFLTLTSDDIFAKGQPSEWQISFQEAASP